MVPIGQGCEQRRGVAFLFLLACRSKSLITVVAAGRRTTDALRASGDLYPKLYPLPIDTGVFWYDESLAGVGHFDPVLTRSSHLVHDYRRSACRDC